MTNAICGTPVNLVSPTGRKEAAFAIDSIVSAQTKLSKKTKVSAPISLKSHVTNVCGKTIKHFKINGGADIKISSSKLRLPGAAEAACVSTVFALTGEIARLNGSINELRIDKYLTDQFYLVDGRVVKKEELLDLCFVKELSFARTVSSLYGGFVVSEGIQVLRSGEMEELGVDIINTKKINQENKSQQQGFEVAWLEALKGNLYAAMNLSAAVGGASVITDKKILAASIDGGRKIMLSHSKNKPFKTMNGGVMVCEKPKRIYKISDFLSLPRASGYSIHSR